VVEGQASDLRSAWQEGTRSGGSATRVLTGLKIAYRTLRPLVVEWPGVPPAPRRADAFSPDLRLGSPLTSRACTGHDFPMPKTRVEKQ
jgi:hypothetical protein